jgi:hydrogenase-4 membrane subunit HyfE
MDEDPKMSEMIPRGRKTKVPFEPEDWVALGVAILGLGALVVAVIATKAVSNKATGLRD